MTGRALWVIWCCLWAGVWPVTAISYYQSPADPAACLLYGTACHQPGWIVAAGFVFGLASLAAIALPVGRTP